MELWQCRTITMAILDKRSGLMITKYLQCNRRDCLYCQTTRAKKYYKIFSSPAPMQLFYAIEEDKKAMRIIYSCRKKGEFYWRCPLPDGLTAIVSTMNKNLQGEPFPTTNTEESISLLRTWMMTQPAQTKVSSTRQVKSEKEKREWQTFWVSGVNLSKIDDFMRAGGWKSHVKGIYNADLNSVDWDVITRFLEASGHVVKEPMPKKERKYVLKTSKTLFVDS